MEQFDYLKIGLKAGLEIHQQLDTSKLFCSCPSYLRNDQPDISITRKLHPVAGETGEIDIAVQHEASLNRTFEYQAYTDTTCLVELDEEPPKLINKEALNEALKIALLLNCEVYPVSQVMRKTVIDGSNTSGFQRTLLLAHDGFVETSFGKVSISNLMLEEDSARIISKNDNTAVYRLDRLGIPLVEIATNPELKSPEQIKEAALKIGEILRVCKIKRGIGTIRQDINMSIRGHQRVEIKGFQEPSLMVSTINKEIKRQREEIKTGKIKGEVRVAKEDASTEFLRPLPGEARMYPETDLPLIKISRIQINEIKKNLPKLKHEIKSDLKKRGLSDELISLVLNGHLEEFETLLKLYSKNANLVAKIITLWRSEFSSKLKKSPEEIFQILNEAVLEKVLKSLASGNILESDVKQVLFKIASGSSIEDSLKIERIDDNKLEEEISKIIKENPKLKPNAYMGLIIQKLGKNIDKRRSMEILQRLI